MWLICSSEVRHSPPVCGLLAIVSFLPVREFNTSNTLVYGLLSAFSCFGHASLCVSGCIALFEFVRRYLSSSSLMIPRPVPGGWADEAWTYCWVLVRFIWVLISRMPSLANLSPL